MSSNRTMNDEQGEWDEEYQSDGVEWDECLAPGEKLPVNSYNFELEGPRRNPFKRIAPAPIPGRLVSDPSPRAQLHETRPAPHHEAVGATAALSVPARAAHHTARPAALDPAANAEPLPAANHLGYVLLRNKHASLKTLRSQSRFRRGTNNIPNRPWIFNYCFPGTQEFGIYYLVCPTSQCPTSQCPAMSRHPLIAQRGENHIRACGGHFTDEADLVRKYGIQVVQEPGGQQLTYDLCRAYNAGIMRDNNDPGVAGENFAPYVPPPDYAPAADQAPDPAYSPRMDEPFAPPGSSDPGDATALANVEEESGAGGPAGPVGPGQAAGAAHGSDDSLGPFEDA